MGKKYKIKTLVPDPKSKSDQLIQDKGEVPKPNLKRVTSQKINFHFKYVDLNHKDFSLSQAEKKYWSKLIERLTSLESMSIQNVIEGGKSTRFHIIDWKETHYKRGFLKNNLSDQIANEQPYQFEVSISLGRVFGLLAGNEFYIIWFDHKHRVYGQ